MYEGQRSSGNFRLWKHLLTINDPLKILPCHFRYFHCSNFKMIFDQKFMKKSYHFLTSSKFLVCSRNFMFWQPLAVKWIQKMPFEQFLNSWNIFLKCGALRDLIPFAQFKKREKHSLFQHCHVLCNKFYEQTTICLNKFSDFL